MNLRHDVMADDAVHDDADTTIVDDELLADELAGIVELAAAFLGSAAGLGPDFAAFSCGICNLDELSGDLWRLGTWIRGNA